MKKNKNKERDYVAVLKIYDLPDFDNKDLDILVNWLMDISKSKIRPTKHNCDRLLTYKLMK